jgi:membrane protein DedA with SNARE-associated domain
MAEAWSAHYGWAGVFFSRLLPVIRHLIGIPAGILRMDFRWYSAATLAGSLLWTSVLAWLGMTVGKHPELLKGSLHRFFLLVLALAAVLAALYYVFVKRPLPPR